MLKKSKSNVGFIICVCLLVLIEIGTLFLMYKSSNNKMLDEVNLTEINSKDSFAILLEQADGTYQELASETTAWPTTGYRFNTAKSGCIDVNGNKMYGILSYDATNYIATVDATKTSYCYLYFDIISADDLVSNMDTTNMSSTLLGGLYRYQGDSNTVNNNYICFGTSDKDLCISDSENYMYRIIGINDLGNLKLIKSEALTLTFQWSSTTASKTWYNNSLRSNLNSDSFLTNIIYIPNNTWKEKIMDYSWHYGNIADHNLSADSIYQKEEELSTINAQIGLMSLSDYYYQSVSNNCAEDNGTYLTCKNGWMGNSSDTIEWTMTSQSYVGGKQNAYAIHPDGYIYAEIVTTSGIVRPVFYLHNTITISGEGTISNPYIIAE